MPFARHHYPKLAQQYQLIRQMKPLPEALRGRLLAILQLELFS